MSGRAPCMTVEPGWLKSEDGMTLRELPVAEIRQAVAAGDDVSIPAGTWFVPEDTVIYGGVKLAKGKLVLTVPLEIGPPSRQDLPASSPTHSLTRA